MQLIIENVSDKTEDLNLSIFNMITGHIPYRWKKKKKKKKNGVNFS